jgi:2-keto-4-pentenoate hydratase/2-oxohepta-3-ene-1,7-dioic acid hydratase in catechol pathway
MQESGGPLGPAKSKDFDDSIILGPVIVTRDELVDPYNLRMQARVKR